MTVAYNEHMTRGQANMEVFKTMITAWKHLLTCLADLLNGRVRELPWNLFVLVITFFLPFLCFGAPLFGGIVQRRHNKAADQYNDPLYDL
jgi:hypothetical protein